MRMDMPFIHLFLFQLKIESEVEKLLLRAQTCRTAIVNDLHHLPQQQPLPPKAPVLTTQQQSGQADKQQNANVKALNSHNLHLVNLLKQNSPHSVSKSIQSSNFCLLALYY